MRDYELNSVLYSIYYVWYIYYMKKYTNLSLFKSKLPILLPAFLLFIVFVTSALSVQSEEVADIKNYSAMGIVESVSSDSLRLDIVDSGVQTFSITDVEKVESKSYVPLSISDILVGDRLIVQGVSRGDSIDLNRIINMTWNEERATTTVEVLDLATSTATTTATSTEVASSTESTEGSGSTGADNIVLEMSTTTVDITTSTDMSNSTTTTDEVIVTDNATTTDTGTDVVEPDTNTNPEPTVETDTGTTSDAVVTP